MYNKSLSPSRRLTKQSRSRTVTRDPTKWCPGSLGALIMSAAYERWLTLNLIDAEQDIRGNIKRKLARLWGVPGPGPANTRPRGCLDSTRPVVVVCQPRVRPIPSSFSLFPSFFPLNLTPSLLWLPNPRMSPMLPHSSNRHP